MSEHLPVAVHAKCLVCGVVGDLPWTCASCSSAYHADCARYSETCSIFGCRGRLLALVRAPVIDADTLLLIRCISERQLWLRRIVPFCVLWGAASYVAMAVLVLLGLDVLSEWACSCIVSLIVVGYVGGPCWCFYKGEQALRRIPSAPRALAP